MTGRHAAAPAPRWLAPALLGAALLMAGAAHAQEAPLSQASAADFERLLEGGPVVKSFRPTRAPDAQNRCADSPGSTDAPSRPGTKNLEVVPYDEDSAVQAQLGLVFGFNSDELTARDRNMLDNLATALRGPRLRDAKFAVAGHTDRSGDETQRGAQNNRQLSCARALSAMSYLVQTRGVDAQRLTAYGFGSERPLEGFGATAPQHRRVEVRRAE